jgi:hypothetical protein
MHKSTASWLAVGFLLSAAPGFAQDAGHGPGSHISLTYKDHSSKKIEQVTGDCDWVVWDPTINTPPQDCKRTTSQTLSRFDVLGHGFGYSFEHDGKLIFLFGDTIGASHQYVPDYASLSLENTFNDFQYHAGDPIAWSTTTRPEDGLLINFFTDGTTPTLPLLVTPKYTATQTFCDGTTSQVVDMGGDDIPNSGISVNGQIYLIVNTNADGSLKDPHLNAYSVLVRFDETTHTFTAGRTISQSYYPLPQCASKNDNPIPGHFVFDALHVFPPEFENDRPGLGDAPLLGTREPVVLIFGEGQYRGEHSGSSLYLSYIPASEFWSGVDVNGNNATRYFTGLDKHGHPTWSSQESDAAPVVLDNPTNLPTTADPGTIGNAKVIYSRDLDFWLMTYDGGRQSDDSTGIYFSYAKAPWGPWAKPQLIFNACRDNGYGNFIHYYFDPSQPDNNICPSAVTGSANASGPAGPTIGDQNPNHASNNYPPTTRGGPFAPELIERFTEVEGDTLKIYYNLSTFNAYTVMKMESDFTIGHAGEQRGGDSESGAPDK